ncbi:family 16 glycosylhydrolase [Aliiglaciecola sp. LCG003]|uniref:family 16 glycosylhydrolase n=1 Tax=Aliiglaciecola sp. LCG003 TaxID=3053655 RepID=UPI00257344DD|nr:family 16 glycosylhydrolase [Aliiglaciecola sp. LCG003]WJG09197.1 family 16 glycosylhydrolase [Aliiglaciecola sp. LCG003]
MKNVNLIRGLCFTLFTLITLNCQADWQNIQADIRVSQSRPALDRVNRVYFSYLTIENMSDQTKTQSMRVLIANSTLPVLNAAGEDAQGQPYFLLGDSEFAPGASVRVRVDFALQRARLSFDSQIQQLSPWDLVWQDEFSSNVIDQSKWSYDIDCNGGGNQEKQCYTDDPENAFVDNGILKIVAKPADGQPLPYSSARLVTKNKAEWTYGRVEVRAKAPRGQGAWPAIWMLPNDNVYGGWPHSGEVDIFEAVNLGVPRTPSSDQIQTDVYGTLHYGQTWPNNDSSGLNYLLPDNQNPADDFHVYAIEWEEGEIRWYVDGVLYQTQRQSLTDYDQNGNPDGLIHKGWYTEVDGQLVWTSAPYDERFHLILNFAVGGSWPEGVNLGGIDPSAFHANNPFEIDYVRVYECSVAPASGQGCATVHTGYDELIADGGTLNLGKAPIPVPPSDGIPTELIVFDNSINPSWPAWDCCGGSTPSIELDDAQHNEVVEFSIGATPTVVGFNTNESDSPQLYDGSPLLANGVLEFDLKLVTAANNADAGWNLKVEQGGARTEAVVSIAAPTEQWQHYSIPLRTLRGAGLDLNGIDVVMIFPDWGQGEGAVFRVDNVIFKQGDETPPSEMPNSRVLVDFEQSPDNYSFVNFDGGVSTLVANPDVSPNNNSAQVVQMQKFFGQPWGGSTLTLDSPMDVQDSQFSMKVWSDRPVNVLFKLEGMNVERNVVHTGSGWENLLFDFTGDVGTGVSQVTIIFDLGVMGNAANDPENWTFYYDDIGIVEPLNSVDFEGPMDSYLFTNFDGGVSTVLANPVPAGINTSAQVVQMQKFAGQPWGGSTFTLDAAIDVDSTVFSMKVWSPRAVNVLLKLEGMNVERNVAHSGAGWETLSFDFSGETGTNVSLITIIFDLGVMGDAAGNPQDWTFYYDDLVLPNELDIPDEPEEPTPSALLIDFEGAIESYALGNFDGGLSTVLSNPHQNSQNDSAQVVQMQKFSGQPWGGSTLALSAPIDVDSTVFSMKVWSARAVSVLFKLEGMNVERSVIHGGTGWEVLSFDFAGETGSAVNQVTIIFDLGVMGDAANDPDYWTFYYDDISDQDMSEPPFITEGFENPAEQYSFNNFDGGQSVIVSNPDSSGINTSAQVVRMQKFAGQPWGGSTITLDSPIDVDGTSFKMKVWSNRSVSVLFKLEGMNVERNVIHSGGGWQELVFDFSGEVGTNVSQITVIFDLGVMGDAPTRKGIDFDSQAGQIIRIDPISGTVSLVLDGLTAPTGIALAADNILYILELCADFLEPLQNDDDTKACLHGGFQRHSGRLLTCNLDSIETKEIIDKLDTPSNIAVHHNQIYISEGMGMPGRTIPDENGQKTVVNGFIRRLTIQ